MRGPGRPAASAACYPFPSAALTSLSSPLLPAAPGLPLLSLTFLFCRESGQTDGRTDGGRRGLPLLCGSPGPVSPRFELGLRGCDILTFAYTSLGDSERGSRGIGTSRVPFLICPSARQSFFQIPLPLSEPLQQ